jgi:hypothetical protein
MKRFVNFLESRRHYEQGGSRRRVVLWYGYQIVMLVLAVTNIGFFIYNITDLQIDIDSTAIFITFVGFLFAFAGINIYSIFNTNIEEEKKRLTDLSAIYEEEIANTTLLLDFSRKQIKYHQLSMVICNSKKFNGQIQEWLGEMDDIISEFTGFLYGLSQEDADNYEKMSKDFIDISRGVYYAFNNFQAELNSLGDQFFQNVDHNTRSIVMEQLNLMCSKLNNLQTKNFSVQDENIEIITERQMKLGEAWSLLFKTHWEKIKTLWAKVRD